MYLSEAYIAKIRKDIPRTFANHPMFADEASPALVRLENTLRAYARFDREVGYCQVGLPG